MPMAKAALIPGKVEAHGATQLVCARAFTLVELLITLVLTGVITAGMISVFLTQTRGTRVAGIRMEAVQRVRFAAELLRREIRLAGSGTPNAQPMVVYAGPSDLVFTADLASSTLGDRVAVYLLPSAPLAETEGADSATLILPNSQAYPQRSYGPSGLPGPAETIHFSFVPEDGGRYSLTRTVNSLPPEVLLRGLMKIGGREFFSYEVMEPEGSLRSIDSGPVWHEAPVHGSDADTATSALSDSVKLVHVAFEVLVRGLSREETVERSYSMAIPLKNAGLIQNSSCGEPPELGVTPTAVVAGPSVTISWPPATDERSGEEDVFQYNLYRRETTETTARRITSMPPNPDLATYEHVDNDVTSGKTYIYSLGATDCTPEQSELGQSGPVDIP